MNRIVFAVCVAASAFIAASASAQPPANEQQRATVTELERLRGELERARESLEAAARNLASRAVPAAPSAVSVLASHFAGERTALGAVLVDAEGGALVTAVVPGGAAANAGIEVGDVIQSIDGVDLSAESSPHARLSERLAQIRPGESVTLAVERAGDVLEYDVETEDGFAWAGRPLPSPYLLVDALSRFGERAEGSGESGGAYVAGNPSGVQVITRPALLRSFTFASSPWGEMELVPMTSGLARYFGTEEGLLVIRGPSDESIGIEDGDVILAIGGRTPSSPEHAIRILASFEPGETIEFSIVRDGVGETVEYAVP